jgi:hypothetical protein
MFGLSSRSTGELKMNARAQHKAKHQNHLITLFLAFFMLQIAFYISASPVHAVPETTAVRITDVTPSSFSVVWMTDVAANPSVEVYADNSLQQQIAEEILISPMPAGSSKAAQAAQAKGIMKVRVSGVHPATAYYVRTVTKDPLNAASVSYSALQQVTTASRIDLYRVESNTFQSLANDLIAFPVYVRPADAAAEPGLGDLVMLEQQDTRYPVSAFVGDGAVSPEGILDMNNLFGIDGANLALAGSEKVTLRIYRAGNLSILVHYRKVPQNSASVSVVGLLSGFFADINLDGNVDDQDFGAFKSQYRTMPDDTIYNPDYNFVDEPKAEVDVREFSKFSKEYGRTDVE